MNQPTIEGIIVTYYPDEKTIDGTIKSIMSQVNKLWIIDNTPNGSSILKNHKLLNKKNNVELITLNENVGIGKAQNIGIQKALNNKADFILLSDQDTFYPDDYVVNMLGVYSKLPDKEKVAVIAPDFAELNRGGERQGFSMFDSISLKRIHPREGCHEISQAIASGSIIPSKIFKDVGFMDEELFMDRVDVEWCWRARAKGYKIIGCADIVIGHHMGDSTKKICSKTFSIRPPIRDYYIVRNAVHFALRNQYITFGMRLNILIKYAIGYTIVYTIIAKPHRKHLIYCLKGLYHGFIKKLGRYE